MTFPATVVRVFLASPGDTSYERDAARRAIARWNATNAAHERTILLPTGWETDATPEWGDHPQSILNRQLVDEADVLVGMFWTRLGTPTPDGVSGTVEEIHAFAATGRPVLLYFCRKSVDLATIEPDQLRALREFEAGCRDSVLYDTYGDDTEFATKLDRALNKVVRDKFGEDAATLLPIGRRLKDPPRPKQEVRLTAQLERTSRNSRRLIIRNSGTVEVFSVDIVVPADAPSFRLFGSELPIEILRPGERVGVPVSVAMAGGKAIFDIHVTGKTADGETVQFPSKISL